MQDPDVGQPCLKCGNGCEGFMLHVWRYVAARTVVGYGCGAVPCMFSLTVARQCLYL